ncbi:hypothetical protein GOBAR_DD04540 [Gossypium barbadense]|nr:hypothetical protein GOBAR_DD04540 [Gossypium barbadense]
MQGLCAEKTDSGGLSVSYLTSGERHSEEYCAMYDICGQRSDGKVLNCPYGSPSVKPDELFSAKIQSLCPSISGNVCCTEDQFNTLRAQVQQAIPFLVGCPACLRNFLNLFCELSCSPNQSLFINVTSVSEINGNLTVDGIDFFVSDAFGEGLYDSCKEVKFGTMNTRAIEFIGAGATNFKELKHTDRVGIYSLYQRMNSLLDYITKSMEVDLSSFNDLLKPIKLTKAPLGFPGSPYAIDFKSTVPDLSGMELMNVSTYSCGDTSLGCSCGDCPSSPQCSNSEPPSPSKKDHCSITIGPIKVRCIDFALAIAYIILVLGLFGWALFHRQRERILASDREPLLKSTDEDEANLSNMQYDENLALELVICPLNKNWVDFEGRGVTEQLKNGAQLSFIQGYMASFYRSYGKWVARNPTLVLCLSLAVVIVLCFGLIRIEVETRPEKAMEVRQRKRNSFLTVTLRPSTELNRLCFGLHSFELGRLVGRQGLSVWLDRGLSVWLRRELSLILATLPNKTHGKPSSIISDDNIQLLFEIQEKVDGIRANYSGSKVSLTDICLKPLGQDCATQSVLQYFKMDRENFDNYGGVTHAEYCFQHYTSSDTCLSAFEAPLDPSTTLGGFSGINYSEASAFVVTYPVNNAIDEAGNGNGKAVAWEKAFIKLAKEELLPLVQSRNLSLSFSSESSIEEELKRESTADIITIAVSYLVMFAYISITLGDASRLSTFYISSKDQEVLLGLSGVVLVMLSVLGSVGFFSAFGVKSTLIIMEVIPFLVLAVGVDNMCILVHAVKRQPLELPLEEQISNALVEVGPSITLASLSEILAFAVGGFTPMPACRVFSLFAAFAVLLDFLLQVTAFVSLIAFDCLRAEDNRIDCFPCIKIPSSAEESDEGMNSRGSGLLTRYMQEIHAPFLGLRGVKVVVVAVFVAFALASIALSTRIDSGLEQQIVLPRDSYLQGYFTNISEYLRIGPPLYFVVKDYNYSLESRDTNKLCSINRCDSNSLLNEISRASLVSESSYIAKPAASWLDDFLVWLSPEAFGCCRKFTNGSYCPPDDQCFRHSDLVNDRPSTEQFREKLPWFLNALPSADCAKGGHGAYTSSVDLSGYESGVIKASEFRTYHTPLNGQGDYVNALRAAREFSSRISDSLKMQIFPYSVFYIFFEQYLDIWTIALTNIAIALGSLWISTIIVLVLVMIVVDLMGVMAILGIQLNAVSVVNLIMSIGIAVEFCVHIANAFLVSNGDRDQRMKKALSTIGASVFSGITLTKLVGVIVLFFSRSELFVVYYFQMYLALVLVGFLHGLVFLPVVLSLMGPPARNIA